MQSESNETVARVFARQLPAWDLLSVERVQEGGSSRVYRVRTSGSVAYLRVLPEDGNGFAPEALVHLLLRTAGARVPEVLFVDDRDPDLGRSVMATSEIRGSAIGYRTRPPNVRAILREAGRDLATINRIPVDGWGWVDRAPQKSEGLRGEFSTYSEWIREHFLGCPSVLYQAGLLDRGEADAIEAIISREMGSTAPGPAFVAHGDFDVTHIYHEDGVYSGIIDFGEIRGTPAMYDLGHFEIENADLLPDLLEGYAMEYHLPDNYRQQISFFCLAIATRRLSRHIQTGREPYLPDLPAVRRARLACDR